MLTENWDKVGFRALQGSWGIKILNKKKKKNPTAELDVEAEAGGSLRNLRLTWAT